MNTPDREWLFREFRSALRALAADGEAALSTLPQDCDRPDELALNFENSVKATVGNFENEFSAQQLAAISELDSELAAMSGNRNSELWTEEAVCRHPRWHKVRELARNAVVVLGWQNAG